jgi:hypothetical protein
MKFSPDTLRYLSGERFSSGLSVPIARPEASIPQRFELLAGLASNKTVIHVGFADHAELVDRKIARNEWLHAVLCRSAARCIGVDVQAEAVENIRQHHNYTDVYIHDLTSSVRLPTITEMQWDWLFLPEVLEHIDNPVHFLTQVRCLYGDHLKGAIITVPNAFELTNLRFLVRQKECINTDHRYWFTPFTLAKVCQRAGWTVEDFSFCQSYSPSGLRENVLLRLFPALRECVVMIVRPK